MGDGFMFEYQLFLKKKGIPPVFPKSGLVLANLLPANIRKSN